MKPSIIKFYAFLAATLLASTGFGEIHPDTELTLYRFYSMQDRTSANVAAYKLIDDFFAPKQIGQLDAKPKNGVKDCNLLLNVLQAFSIEVMKEAKYLSEEEALKQSDMLFGAPRRRRYI